MISLAVLSAAGGIKVDHPNMSNGIILALKMNRSFCFDVFGHQHSTVLTCVPDVSNLLD